MKILLTGFEPNDNGLNASEILVKSLEDNLPPELSIYGDNIEFKIMPGNTNILGQIVEQTLQASSPDICILIGQAKGYNRICFEKMAKNLKYFVTLDKAGNAPKGEEVVPNAPVAYWSCLPAQEDLVSLLESHKIPARISNDCGTHLCNQIFYHFLHWKHTNNSDMKVGFIHIPILPEQVINSWSDSAFMPIEMTRKALALIIEKQLYAVESKIIS